MDVKKRKISEDRSIDTYLIVVTNCNFFVFFYFVLYQLMIAEGSFYRWRVV